MSGVLRVQRQRRERKMNKEQLELAERKAREHWETYVKKIVEIHESDSMVVEKVGVHYILTFIHGFKHGVESVE